MLKTGGIAAPRACAGSFRKKLSSDIELQN
jgi:hypothetical protein